MSAGRRVDRRTGIAARLGSQLLLATISLVCAVVVASAAGEPIVGAVVGVPALVLWAASSVGLLTAREGEDPVTRVQAARLAGAVSLIDADPGRRLALRDRMRGPYTVLLFQRPATLDEPRSLQATLVASSSLVRALDDGALRGFAALLLGQLAYSRWASRSVPRRVGLCAVFVVLAVVGAVLVPHRYAPVGALSTIALSGWLWLNGSLLFGREGSVRIGFVRADDVAVALIGDRRPVIAALEAISTWQRDRPRDALVRVSAILARLWTPAAYGWQSEARADRLTQAREAPTETRARSSEMLAMLAATQPPRLARAQPQRPPVQALPGPEPAGAERGSAHRNRRTRLGLAVAVAVVAAGVIAALPHSHHSNPTTGFAPIVGRFAGYTWDGPTVSSVQASWTVPHMLADTPPGQAGTWIGAEGPGPNGLFIQVGTNEIQQPIQPPARHRTPPYYYAFWTDTKHHFRGQYLFAVSPGDAINASLTLVRDQWTIRLDDTSSAQSATLSTRDEANGPFDEAAWLQEHLVPGGYPRLSRLVFRNLAVNGSAPGFGGLGPRWMSLPRHQSLAPTQLTGDSFAIDTATP